jgi:hypothetical protein
VTAKREYIETWLSGVHGDTGTKINTISDIEKTLKMEWNNRLKDRKRIRKHKHAANGSIAMEGMDEEIVKATHGSMMNNLPTGTTSWAASSSLLGTNASNSLQGMGMSIHLISFILYALCPMSRIGSSCNHHYKQMVIDGT